MCYSFSTFLNFHTIFQVLLCTFLIFHLFQCFSTYFQVKQCLCLIFELFHFLRHNPGPMVYISHFSCFSLFLAIFQVLQCAFHIFHIFAIKYNICSKGHGLSVKLNILYLPEASRKMPCLIKLRVIRNICLWHYSKYSSVI